MNKNYLRILAVLSGLVGVAILIYIFVPIFFYEINSSSKFEKSDYTKASNWFLGGATLENFKASKVSFYTVSIPRLKIENASVAIGGEDLARSLIQYPGTALPGKNGNAVIFGHSILPQFYDPKDYLAIFSLLPSLKKGDEISISYDGIFYKYKVEQMFEVEPTNIEVLAQDSSDSFVTLVTCVPPGHPLKPKRLVVKARIQPVR